MDFHPLGPYPRAARDRPRRKNPPVMIIRRPASPGKKPKAAVGVRRKADRKRGTRTTGARVPRFRTRRSAEAAGDVVLGRLLGRVGEYLLGVVQLDQPAGLAHPGQVEEPGLVAHPRG